MKVYNCRTKEDAKKLLLQLHNMGIVWSAGTSLLKKDYWENHGVDMCYRIDDIYNRLSYGNRDYYLENGYKVVIYHGTLAISDLLKRRENK